MLRLVIEGWAKWQRSSHPTLDVGPMYNERARLRSSSYDAAGPTKIHLLFFSCLFFAGNTYAQTFSLTDDVGHRVELAASAKRIIALSPELTELVYAAGAGQFLVGRDQASDYPEASKNLPIVANYVDLNLEKILQLKPDLILAWQGSSVNVNVQRLQQFGIPVYSSQIKQPMDIAATIEHIGFLAGTEVIAKKEANQVRKQWRLIQDTYQSHPNKPTVFYQLWDKPLMTVNSKTLIGQFISACSGNNIFATSLLSSPQVSEEAVLKANPDIIIISQAGGVDWKQWPQLAAVRKHRVYYLSNDNINRATPRALASALEICKYFVNGI